MALSPIITNLLYGASQVAVGTGITFSQATTPATRVRSCEFKPAGQLALTRDGTYTATGVPVVAVQGARFFEISLEVEVFRFSSYTDIDSSPISWLLKACGTVTATTFDPGSGVVDAIALDFSPIFNPPTSPVPCTIEKHEIGGDRYRATDCIGVITAIEGDANAELIIKATLKGAWSTPVASTFTAAAADYGASEALQTPMLFMGAALTSGIRRTNGTTEQTFTGLRNVGIVPAMTVTERLSALAGAINGYATPFLTRSGASDSVAFTVDEQPEGDGVTDLSVWANWVAMAQNRDFRLTINEGTGLQRMFALMSVVQYTDPPVQNTSQPLRQYDLAAMAKDPYDGSTAAGLRLLFTAGV